MRYSYLINKRKNNNNHSGYTLVELLAIIVVLSLIIGIVIVFANGIINNVKEKSYRVTVNNIEKIASGYAIENQIQYEWIDNETDNSKEFFCVSVGDLMEMGFLDNETLDSYIAKDEKVKKTDYIYLERDITSKAITKNLLVSYYKDKFVNYCNNYNTGVDIEFIEEPIGWAREKKLTIRYKIFNLIDKLSTYEYRYVYKDELNNIVKEIDNKNFDNLVETEVIDNVTLNGVVDAYVNVLDDSKKHVIDKIDRDAPLIQLSIDGKSIDESKIIGKEYAKSRNVTISLVDNQSGLKKGNYTIKYDWSLEDKSCDELTNSVVINVNNDTSSIVSKDVLISDGTGMGKLYVCGIDISDNVGNVKDKSIYNIDLYLDNVKPTIAIGDYNGKNTVTGMVTIPIVVQDNDSGIKDGSFTIDDIEVYIGDTKIEKGFDLLLIGDGNYNLKIDSFENGRIVLKIGKDKVFDNVSNGNVDVNIDTNISFNNIYTISYDANGGSGAPESQEKKHGETIILSNIKPTRNGYKFLGWSTDKNSTSATYSAGGSYVSNADVILYAVWDVVKSMSIKCDKYEFGEAPYVMTYTGKCIAYNDGNNNWRIKFLTSGILTSTEDFDIDAFLVGGGGGGGSSTHDGVGGGGGAGGYTFTNSTTIVANQEYKLTIGKGGSGAVYDWNIDGTCGGNGGETTGFNLTVNGGGGGCPGGGGTGGSGGGGGGFGNGSEGANGKFGASNGGNGGSNSPSWAKGGRGQGTTTGEFGVNSGTLYSGGGGGGRGCDTQGCTGGGSGGSGGGAAGAGGNGSGSSSTANTGGGGGGGGARHNSGGNGGSGIIVIRNKR